MSEELQLLKEVADKLNTAGIPYMVSGSIAMIYYAQPRMTRDIDIVIALNRKDVGRFVKMFQGDFCVDEEMVISEVERRGMFNIIHNRFVIKVDFILQKEGEYDDVAFGRRVKNDIDGVPVSMITPEDLIIRKLLWGKDSYSELQKRDVKNMFEMCPNLDSAYIDKWVERLALKEYCDEARK